MTVAALPATISYLEDGVSTSFAVPFRFRAAADLVVERIAGGIATVLALGIDYAVSGGATDAGGTLMRTAATSGAILKISRETARSQPMTYTTGDRFPANSHEEALDRAILISQELDAGLSDTTARAVMVPPGEAAALLAPAAARTGGNKVIGPNRVTGAVEVIDVGNQFKGDPGGNAMAVGPFTAIATLAIPIGTDLIQTSGWLLRGVGAARYAYDAAVDAAFVAANPRSAVISANGRGFRLAEPVINVQMFGALGDALNDDVVPAQAARATATASRPG